MMAAECAAYGWMLRLMIPTSLDSRSVYRLMTSIRMFCRIIGDLSREVRLSETSGRQPGELQREGWLLGVAEEAGLTNLGVLGRVMTRVSSSRLMPRFSDILATTGVTSSSSVKRKLSDVCYETT